METPLKVYIIKRKHCVINRLLVRAKDKREAEEIVKFGEWDRQMGVIETQTYLTFESERDLSVEELNDLNKSIDEFN